MSTNQLLIFAREISCKILNRNMADFSSLVEFTVRSYTISNSLIHYFWSSQTSIWEYNDELMVVGRDGCYIVDNDRSWSTAFARENGSLFRENSDDTNKNALAFHTVYGRGMSVVALEKSCDVPMVGSWPSKHATRCQSKRAVCRCRSRSVCSTTF